MTHSPNFLELQDRAKVIRPRRRIFISIVGVFAVLAFFGVSIGPAASLFGARATIREGERALEEAGARAAEQDFVATDRALERAQSQFSHASDTLRRVGWFRRLPWLGTQLAATDRLIETSLETIVAGREVVSFANDLFAVIQEAEWVGKPAISEVSPAATLGTLSPLEKRTLLARLAMSIPKLEAARARIDTALAHLGQIPSHNLAGPLRRALSTLETQLPRFRDDLDRIIPLAHIIPVFAGYPESKTTLILFLNNAELRPGGGFIGAVGRVEFAEANVRSFETKDSYAIDQPAEAFLNVSPPKPLTQYLGSKRWFMRDANWSPDFAESARLVVDFYEREISGNHPRQTIDQVIGFTPTFASEILRLTGPIRVEDQTFTAKNLFETLEYQVERGFTETGTPYEQRKEILAKLVDQTVTKLTELPAARWEEVLNIIDRGFREKQLMLYAHEPQTQAILEGQGWAGSLEPLVGSGGDFFMVVDANLGSLKSDPVVKRVIHYEIIPADDRGYRATVSITYRHEGNFDWKTTRYRTYTRLLVPREVEFTSAEGLLKDDRLKNPRGEPGVVEIENVRESDGFPFLQSFGVFTAIEPGEERTLSFSYHFPAASLPVVDGSCYELKVGKQLGAFAHELTLDLDFGKTVTRAEPAEAVEEFGDQRYRVKTDLAEDREFTVCFSDS